MRNLPTLTRLGGWLKGTKVPRDATVRFHLPRVTTQIQPPGSLAASISEQTVRHTPVGLQTYEITFTGRAGAMVRTEFDDCDITSGPDTTTLRADLPDQAALIGLIQRVDGLRLELICVQRLTPLPGGRTADA